MIGNKQKKQAFLFMVKLSLIISSGVVFALIYYAFYRDRIYIPFFHRGNLVVILLFIILYAGFSKLYGGLNLSISRISELFYSLTVSLIFTHCIMYIILCLLVRSAADPLPLIQCLAVCSLISALWAYLGNKFTNVISPPYRTLLIYQNENARTEGLRIIKTITWRFKLNGQVYIGKKLSDIFTNIQASHAEAVIICGVSSDSRNEILKYCIEHDVLVFLRPNSGDFILRGAASIQAVYLPILFCQRSSPSLIYLAGKRVFDIFFGILMVVAASPIMAVTAAAIKLCDHGPVFYYQKRLTKDRKEFTICKFRSMEVNAEVPGNPLLAKENDSRITAVGRLIRSCHIDELPQLFNIIVGNMSFVGPRPERPEITELCEKSIPEFSLRLQVKAGLTGYAQVYGKYNTSPYDKLQMDLLYISKLGFATDLKIILATVKVLFMPENAQSINSKDVYSRK